MNGFWSEMDLAEFSFWITAIMGGVLILALLSRQENKIPNIILSLGILGAIAFEGVLSLKITGKIVHYPLLWRIPIVFSVWVNTLLYFYILSLTIPGFEFRRIRAIYYFPFGFAFTWYLIFQFLPKDSIFWSDPEYILYERYCRGVFAFLIKSYFLFLCFYQLHKYHNYVKLFFSEVRKIRLTWLVNLLAIFTIPWMMRGLDLLTGPFWTIDKYAAPMISILILGIGFLGLRQAAIFVKEDKNQLEVLEAASSYEDRVGYALKQPMAPEDKSPTYFTEAELEKWKQRLEKFMDEKRPYLNPELHLADLAEDLKLKPYKVSEILNRGFKESFYNFINRYRIQEAKARLQDPRMEHLSILAIANDSGFNTKSVFNEVFRKYTGQTPSQLRKSTEASPPN